MSCTVLRSTVFFSVLCRIFQLLLGNWTLIRRIVHCTGGEGLIWGNPCFQITDRLVRVETGRKETPYRVYTKNIQYFLWCVYSFDDSCIYTICFTVTLPKLLLLNARTGSCMFLFEFEAFLYSESSELDYVLLIFKKWNLENTTVKRKQVDTNRHWGKEVSLFFSAF